jgi:hypothetical protein
LKRFDAMARRPERKQGTAWWKILLLVPLFFLLLVLIAFFLAWRSLLLLIIWSCWCTKGRDVLFVYSDSPIWHDHIEQNILPHLRERAIILNWSQRKQWPFGPARIAFRHFGGNREFNPMAVVFRPFRPTRTFRFWEPFQDFKRGKPEAVLKMEQDFLKTIGVRRDKL